MPGRGQHRHGYLPLRAGSASRRCHQDVRPHEPQSLPLLNDQKRAYEAGETDITELRSHVARRGVVEVGDVDDELLGEGEARPFARPEQG